MDHNPIPTGRSGVIRAALLFTCLGLLTPPAVLGAGPEDSLEADQDVPETFWAGTWKRITDVEREEWEETADHVLVRTFETKWHRYLKAGLNLPGWLDLGLENRTRYEGFDHPWRVGEQGYDAQIPQRSRLRIGLNGGPLRFLAELQDSRTHLNDATDFNNTTVTDTTDVLQLFGSLTLRNVMGTGLRTDLHFGRMTLDFGRRRYIARNDFRNTTNSFNGVHWQLARENDWRVRAFFVAPTIRAQQRPDKFDTDYLFWGVYYETKQSPWFQTNLYYFGLNDQRSSVSNQRQLSTFGLRVYKSPREGEIDYEVETAFQTGRVGGKDHFAYNPHAEMGYTFRAPWEPRLVFQYDYASGTSNPNGSQNGTFDKLFGARRFEFMPTGIFGPFFRSNISSPGGRIVLQPAGNVRLQLKVRAWYLAQSRDAFAGSGLQDPTGQAGNNLGQDLEVRAQWNVHLNLAFDVGYDHWFKGSYFDRLAAQQPSLNLSTKDSDYFYALAKVRF